MFETYYSSTPIENTKSSSRWTVQDRQTFHPEHVDRGITTQLTFVASSAASSSSSSSKSSKIVGVDSRRRRSRMNKILASECTTKGANTQSKNEGVSFYQSHGSVYNDIKSTDNDFNFNKSSSSVSKQKIKLAKSKVNVDFDQSLSYDDTQPYEIVSKGSRSSSLSTTSSSKGSGFQRGISRLLPTPSSRRKSHSQKSGSVDEQLKFNSTRQFSDNTSVTSGTVSEGAISRKSINRTQSQQPKRGSLPLHENAQRLNSDQLANILNYCAESPFLHPERQPQREQEKMSSPNFNAIKNIFESRDNLRDCVMETIRREQSDDEVDNRKSVHFRSSISSYRDDPLSNMESKASSSCSSRSQDNGMDTTPSLSDDVSHLPDMEEMLDQEMLEIECQKLIREQIMRLYEQEHYRKLGKREISSCLTTSTVNSSESSSSTTSSTKIKTRSSHDSSTMSKETTKTTQSTTDMDSFHDSTTTISTTENSKSSVPSMNSNQRSMTSIGISRSHSLTDADASTKTTITATLQVPPSNFEIANDNDVLSEILPVTVRRDNTRSARTMSILTKKATIIPAAQTIDQALDDESVKFETASVNRSRNIFHSLSIQPSFLSFSSKNSGSQKQKVAKKVDKKSPQRRKASSPQVKSPSTLLPAFFSDRILSVRSKTTSKADSGYDVPTKMSTAKGVVPTRSQVVGSLQNTESKNTKKTSRNSRNTKIIAKPNLQRSPSNSTRNTTRSAGPIDVDSVVEIYGEASSSSDQSITITYDQSSHYGRTIATSTAMIPLQSSTHHARDFFDFLPCAIDDDDYFCPPILNEVGIIEQVSPTQLGVRRQNRLGNGLSLVSSSSNVSFTCSEGGASTTDTSVASEISEGPVDVDGFIPKDSYYLYDKHFIILDETDISRGLIGYEVGFEPDMVNRKESKYIDYKKTSNLWKVPSAIYEDAAEEVNESEDEVQNNNQKTTSNYQHDNNLDDLQYFSKIVDRIDTGQDDEYDDNYRIKKTANTCSTNMFSL